MHSCTQSSNVFPNICATNTSMALYLLIITKGKYNFLDLKTNVKKKKKSNKLNTQGFTKTFNCFDFSDGSFDDTRTIVKVINTSCFMEQCWLTFDICVTFILSFSPYWNGYALYQRPKSLETITPIIRSGHPILVEQIDLANSVSSQRLRWLIFLLRSFTVIIMMLRCNVASISFYVSEDEIHRTIYFTRDLCSSIIVSYKHLRWDIMTYI